MEKIYHVFVSSTYQDLKEERRAVSESIARAGYVPEGMEIFPASSQKQIEFIQSVIDRCDYYILITAGKYGSIHEDNKSYTRTEFEYALSKNIPVLAFIHDSIKDLSESKRETSAEKIALLNEFHEEIKSNSMVDFWNEKGILAAKALAALAQEVNRNPQAGWVRGSRATQLEKDLPPSIRIVDKKIAESGTQIETSEDRVNPDSSFTIKYKDPRKPSANYYNTFGNIKKYNSSIKITPKELLINTASKYRDYNNLQPARDFVHNLIKDLILRYKKGVYHISVEIDNEDFEVLVMAMVDLKLWEHTSGQFKLGEKGRQIYLESKTV